MIKTVIAWVDCKAQSVEFEYPDYAPKRTTLEDRISALEKMQSPESIGSVNLYAANWAGEASPYSQVVAIDGITKYSKVDLQPSTEQLAIFYQKDLAFVAENENGLVTVFCVGQKPTNDYTIQITVTEVVVNE